MKTRSQQQQDSQLKKRTSRKELLSLCGDVHPDDGIDPRYLVTSDDRSQRTGRAASLCQHVRKILSLVLAGDFGDERLTTLDVVSVEPMPTGGRLLVLVRPASSEDDFVPDDLLRRLDAIRPHLRQEVARSIRRRRAPDFAFRILPPEQGSP